ncbi:hypothetical protein KIL84_001659, partial [Mauremys mutica]
FFDVEAEHDIITAVIGENAILPCRLITKHLPPSMELQWRKVGPGEVKTIYLYFYDESSPRVNSYPQDDKCSNGYLSPNGVNSREWLRKKYEKKAEVFKGKEFGKGNISLKLNNIQVEDAGKYVCSATANSFHREIITDVLVIEELQEETAQLKEEKEESKEQIGALLCLLLCIAVTIFPFPGKCKKEPQEQTGDLDKRIKEPKEQTEWRRARNNSDARASVGKTRALSAEVPVLESRPGVQLAQGLLGAPFCWMRLVFISHTRRVSSNLLSDQLLLVRKMLLSYTALLSWDKHGYNHFYFYGKTCWGSEDLKKREPVSTTAKGKAAYQHSVVLSYPAPSPSLRQPVDGPSEGVWEERQRVRSLVEDAERGALPAPTLYLSQTSARPGDSVQLQCSVLSQFLVTGVIFCKDGEEVLSQRGLEQKAIYDYSHVVSGGSSGNYSCGYEIKDSKNWVKRSQLSPAQRLRVTGLDLNLLLGITIPAVVVLAVVLYLLGKKVASLPREQRERVQHDTSNTPEDHIEYASVKWVESTRHPPSQGERH